MSTLWAGDQETVQLATRIPKSLHRAIRLDAIEHGESLMAWITEALKAHVERVGRAKAEKPVGIATR